MEGKKGCLGSFFETAKPYIAMISLQFGYAGMNIITKVSLNRGMSHYVLVVYRHAFATAVIAPFALESEAEDQLHNFLAALRVRTSWAGDRPELVLRGAEVHFSDILLRDEQHAAGDDLRDGSDVQNGDIGHEEDKMPSKGGGNSSHRRWSHAYDTLQRSCRQDVVDWVKGSILLIIATFAWASFFILQAITLRKYTAQLSLTALVCFMGTLQSIVVTLIMEHRPHAWAIGFDMNLLAAAYAGIVSSSIAYYVQGLVMQKRGPVFVTAFSPLMMIIVAIMGSFILAEKIYLGGVLGGVLIVIGLYSVLWGKYKEFKDKEAEEFILEPVKDGIINHHSLDIEANTNINNINIQLHTNEENRMPVPALAISAPMPMPPMLAVEAPKP
ncbi:nodulin MtN21 /EamA-like transporter family protein [Perilla frutescens var. hirtella]|uniref:WAT1-related protein n=1 Tax=Perilla frutescens var. hirtella TaxID=608512 RepID=A0AAD4PB36_PERFH|nr:nodulin MtN21 /EamA-like transporter family protein [Perilla frutescens var. hirtella]